MLQFLDASIETLIKFELYTTNMPYLGLSHKYAKTVSWNLF